MRKMTAKLNITENKRTVEKNQWTQKWVLRKYKNKNWQAFLLEWPRKRKRRFNLPKSGIKGGHQYWPYIIKNNFKRILWTIEYK